MIVLVCIIAICFCSALSVVQAGSTVRHFEVKGKPSLTIKHAAGSIRIVKGEPGQVVLLAESDSEDLTVIPVQRDDQIMIEQSDASLVNIDYDISFPAEGELIVTSYSGSIDIRGIDGNFWLSTTIGSITVAEMQGRLVARSQSGDVLLQNIGAADLDVRSESGSIVYSAGRLDSGSYHLTSPEGEIQVFHYQDASYSIRASARQGEILSYINRLQPSEDSLGEGMILNTTYNGSTSRLQLTTDEGYITLGLDVEDKIKLGGSRNPTTTFDQGPGLFFTAPHLYGCPCHSNPRPTIQEEY